MGSRVMVPGPAGIFTEPIRSQMMVITSTVRYSL